MLGNPHFLLALRLQRLDEIVKVAFEYLEISDHLITRREAQQSFTDMVVRWLDQRVLIAAPPALSAR